MSKILKKRLKDLDGLHRKGQFWEWLRLVESEGLTGDLLPDYEAAWKALLRRALRSPEGFSAFWKSAPKGMRPLHGKDKTLAADYGFLLALKGLIEGTAVDPGTLPIEHLSPPARSLRERVVLLKGRPFSSTILRKALQPFILTPQTVTRRHFQTLGAALRGHPYAASVARLADLHVEFRSVTGKRSLTLISEKSCPELFKGIDQGLKRLSSGLPPGLFRVLLFPTRVRLAGFLRQLPPAIFQQGIRQILPSLPFLFPLTAEEKTNGAMEALRGPFPVEIMSGDRRRAESWLAQVSFEERVRFLGYLRRKVLRNGDSLEEDPLDGLFDPVSVLRLFYRSMLSEVGEMMNTLSSRERALLTETLDEIAGMDLPNVLRADRRPEGLYDFLCPFHKAQCLGRRLSFAALFIARSVKDGGLTETADQVLDKQGFPLEEEFRWILGLCSPLFLPSVNNLIPILERLKGDERLWLVLCKQIIDVLERLLPVGSRVEMGFLSDGYLKGGQRWTSQQIRVLLKELQQIPSYPGFAPLRTFILRFSKGLTDVALAEWLEDLRGLGRHIPYILLRLDRNARLRGSSSPAADFFTEFEIAGQVEIIAQFLLSHVKDFETMDLVDAKALLAPLLSMAPRSKIIPSFLVKVKTLLEKRIMKGEEAFTPLAEEVFRVVIALRGDRPSSRGRRRRR